jgi:hypothetical protein
MQKLLLLLSFSLFAISFINGQSDKSGRKSPPVVVTDTIQGVTVTVDYSSPRARGRELFGGLVPYNKVWRTGANEATKVSFNEDVIINGKNLEAGTYSLFSIPAQDQWTMIFNEVADQWGHYKYDESKDALRVQSTPESISQYQDEFAITLSDHGINITWGNLSIPLEVKS